jgi:hypothetical protein
MAAIFGMKDVIKQVVDDDSCENIGKKHQEEQNKRQQLVQPVARLCLYRNSINAGAVFEGESLLWLRGIFRRLASRKSIRRPYYSEITRDIPKEMFLVLTRALKKADSPMFKEPTCYITGNKKVWLLPHLNR